MSHNSLLQLGKRRKIVAGRPQLPKRRLGRIAAMATLIALAALALVGPTGVRAWSDAGHVLRQRQAELAALRAKKDSIANRVELLDPANADPDLVGELLRRNLNVAGPDEVVVQREQ